MIVKSKIKDEKSCLCYEHGRLPDTLSTMWYNDAEDKFIKEVTKVVDNKVTINKHEYVFPEGSTHHQIAFDALGEYVRTWMLGNKGFIDYMDNLTNKRVVKEVECTSMSCGISSVYTYSDRISEVLVAYTSGKKVFLLEQSNRFQEPKEYANLSTDKARIRVCGATSSNRFLIRFYHKIKEV